MIDATKNGVNPPDRIVKTPGVVGGKARVRDTRIPVWVLVGYRRSGWSDAQFITEYPYLTRDDLAAVWEYANAHAEEIEQAIRKNDEGGEDFAE
jgi:uncharacterized protein (DUF433 family)